MRKKVLIGVAAMVLVLCCTVGGTFAWLMDQTAPVKNTFTIGDINITLTETTAVYKMIPGNVISKDPKVTVKASSEACWLFVKIEESSNFDDFMTYNLAAGWTELTTGSGVYYRSVAATAADTAFPVLKDNQVSVRTDVTKQELNALTETTRPTLTFTAYAIQQSSFATAASAWAAITG